MQARKPLRISIVFTSLWLASTSAAQEVAPTQDQAPPALFEVLRPESGGLTAVQAGTLATQNAPEVAVANAQVAQRIAQTRQTMSRYVPNVQLTAGITRQNAIDIDFGQGFFTPVALNEGPLQVGACPDGNGQCVVDSQGQGVFAAGAQPFEIPLTGYRLEGNLTVPFSDYVLALSPARKGAEASERAARHNRDAQLATVSANAQIAYYDWLKAVAQVAIAKDTLESMEGEVRDAEAGVQAGLVTSTDLLGLQTALAGAMAGVKQAESFERLAERSLRMTTQFSEELKIGEDVFAAFSVEPELRDIDKLIARGHAERHELLAIGQDRKAMKHAIDGAAANRLPRLDGFANVLHANPNQAFFPPGPEWNTSWTIGLNLSWRLDATLSTQAQLRELRATETALEAQGRQMRRAIELEVRSAYEELTRAEESERVGRLELSSAEAQREQRWVLFLGGEATSTDVAQADLQRANALLRVLQATIDKRVALVKLKRAAAWGFGK